MAMAQVAAATRDLPLTPTQRQRLGTAAAEATMNAMEHGNGFRPEIPVLIVVRASPGALSVRIRDEGGGRATPGPSPILEAAAPDLEAKLAGSQPPRGWGLFLIKSLVDEMRVTTDGDHHAVELTLRLEGRARGGQSA